MATKVLREAFLVEGTILNDTDNSSFPLEKSIVNVSVKNEYINQVMPLFVVDLYLTEDKRDIIRDNRIRLALKIFSYNSDENSQTNEEDTEDPTISSVLFDGIIRIYDKSFETSATHVEEEGDDEQQKTSAPYFTYRLIGIPESIIEINSTTVNNVYKNVTLDDVLVNISSYVNSGGTFFIDKTNSQLLLQSVFIPPLTYTQAVDFLDDNFQIYGENPCSIYMDLNKTYIYNPFLDRGSNSVLEYRVLEPENSTNNSEISKPIIDDESNIITFTSKVLPGYKSTQDIIGNSIGSNSIFYSYGDNFELVTRSISEDTNNVYNKTKYIWNDKRNYVFEKALKDMTLTMSSAITFILTGISPEHFNPLTTISINSKYTEANGKYFVNRFLYSLSSSDYKHFNSTLFFECIKKK